jgi:Mg/Co/Ni transporter MgtE
MSSNKLMIDIEFEKKVLIKEKENFVHQFLSDEVIVDKIINKSLINLYIREISKNIKEDIIKIIEDKEKETLEKIKKEMHDFIKKETLEKIKKEMHDFIKKSMETLTNEMKQKMSQKFILLKENMKTTNENSHQPT